MSTTFPEGFKCGADLRASYPAAEREMLPLIKRKSGKILAWAPYIEFDDAVQEGRLALLRALMNFDSAYPDTTLKKYVSKTLDNCYKDMFYRAVAQMRMPRVPVRDMDGEWRIKSVAPYSLDTPLDDDDDHMRFELADDAPDAEAVLCSSYLDEEARRFKMKLYNALKPFEQEVFKAKFNPPIALFEMCDNEGIDLEMSAKHIADQETDWEVEVPNHAVAAYLSTEDTKITKNKIDWSMYKIRDAFSLLVRDMDFSDLFGSVVGSEGWPMVHVDAAPMFNRDFKQGVLRHRKLDGKPIEESPDVRKGRDCSRVVYTYKWGVVMHLIFDGEHRTVVVEGDRVNVNSGGVHSNTRGVQEQLVNYVPWYNKLVKRLKEAGNE